MFSDRLLQQLSVGEDDVVMDVGCGGGLTSIELTKKIGQRGRVVGVDISPQILAVAQQRGSDIANVEFKECDAGTADLGKEVFDLIISRFGVMFFEEPVAAFSNLKQVFKPSGKLAVLVWRTFKENPWMAEPTAAVMEVLPPKAPPSDKPDPDAPGSFSLGETERVSYVLESAGFNNIKLGKVDLDMKMGSIDEALGFLMEMGPAAGTLVDASDEQRAVGAEAIRKVLTQYVAGDEVILPSAAWLVTATSS